VKLVFRKEKFAHPALLLTYSIPPGASEGVHTHSSSDTKEGSFDEFYYIISGSSEMQIADQRIPATACDPVLFQTMSRAELRTLQRTPHSKCISWP
jgi:hypothetical protein